MVGTKRTLKGLSRLFPNLFTLNDFSQALGNDTQVFRAADKISEKMLTDTEVCPPSSPFIWGGFILRGGGYREAIQSYLPSFVLLLSKDWLAEEITDSPKPTAQSARSVRRSTDYPLLRSTISSQSGSAGGGIAVTAGKAVSKPASEEGADVSLEINTLAKH